MTASYLSDVAATGTRNGTRDGTAPLYPGDQHRRAARAAESRVIGDGPTAHDAVRRFGTKPVE
ncbi:hypothetical protein [Natronorubrum sp. A-ect3]|uniref:hypothetical protein n=1 Tax=Natronorubrum sp. A-ect3 TaxID=3242698 RepID=UPI00359DAC0B